MFLPNIIILDKSLNSAVYIINFFIAFFVPILDYCVSYVLICDSAKIHRRPSHCVKLIENMKNNKHLS